MEDGLAEEFDNITIDYTDSGIRKGFSIIPDGLSGGC